MIQSSFLGQNQRGFFISFVPSDIAIAERYPQHVAGFGMPEFVALIINQCLSKELHNNQQAIGEHVLVTLGVCEILDEKHMTSIGVVQSIGCHSVIEAGTRISNHTEIGNYVTFEAGSTAETGAFIGDFTLLETGAAVRAGASVGSQCYLGKHAEVNYDATLDPNEKLEPHEIQH